MNIVLIAASALAIIVALVVWYRYERTIHDDAIVYLQSEHEHFHLHVELPDHLEIQPGDTLHILNMPALETGRTDGGEVVFDSPIRLIKASWLRRHLTMTSSIMEVVELVDHP